MLPRYRCKRCGRDEVEARTIGCPRKAIERDAPCPMEKLGLLASIIRWLRNF